MIVLKYGTFLALPPQQQNQWMFYKNITSNWKEKKLNTIINALCSLRTDTQFYLTLHFIPFGTSISFCLFVSKPVAFLVLERNNLGDYQPPVFTVHVFGLFKTYEVWK